MTNTNNPIEEIREKLEAIYDDYRNGTLKELDAIKHIGINDEKDSVVLIVETSQKESKAEDDLKRKIAKVIKLDLGYSGVKIQFEEAKTIANIASSSTKIIFVAGLSGGSGKSTFTINLAYALKRASKKVAIIDADIYEASIVKMLKASDSGLNVNSLNKIVPPRHDGIELMSIDFFSSDENDALMWRAEMLSSMVNNYIFQVAWDKDTDYILVDLPATTGDTLIDIASYVPNASVIIVSNEDRVGAISAFKTYKAIKELNLDLIGIVVNKYTGNDYANDYLTKQCADTEVLTKIPYAKLDDNYRFLDASVKQIFDDLAAIVIVH